MGEEIDMLIFEPPRPGDHIGGAPAVLAPCSHRYCKFNEDGTVQNSCESLVLSGQAKQRWDGVDLRVRTLCQAITTAPPIKRHELRSAFQTVKPLLLAKR
jgi:hypothetical protein